ncbi:MAG: GIY-YIG nuclease family protein [Myxococcales bacterium]|nr:GIY-YIG nuclease family protein [Myxococcales bacterium]
MTSATIKLFLPDGDAKGLRTAEISNWTGKALAAPRTELDRLVIRDECEKAGVYVLTGSDPVTNAPHAYVGESEVIRDRLKQHKGREFWVSVIVFVSKDENLTKAHVRYLESQLLMEARRVGRFTLEQNQATGSRLPESDREDMEVFLSKIRQLLPVLGSDLLTPVVQVSAKGKQADALACRIKGAEARGQRTADGFVVFQGSTAVLADRPSAQQRHPFVVTIRRQLQEDGTLLSKSGFLLFTKDVEFSSPSAAASVVHGGGANGLLEWKKADGTTLKDLDEKA